MNRRQVVIVGAGPAGMAAAITLCREGVSPTVIDENPQSGGQIYRQPRNASQQSGSNEVLKDSRGNQLHRQFQQCREQIEHLCDNTVWGIYSHRQVACNGPDGCQMFAADHLLLATGAYEYVCPFPGWTLPGVMTPGAAQSLVKSHGVRPGKTAIVAGTGPFLLVVALQLHNAGVKVAAIVETARRRDLWRHCPGLLRNLAMFVEGAGYMRKIRQAGIPMLWGHVVTCAEGNGEVAAAVVAPCNEDGVADPGQARRIPVDTLCVAYGFVPRFELAQLAGCEMEYRDIKGGWIPKMDQHLATSIPGVWVAGDGGGVAGAIVAELEGTLAGLAIANSLGRIDTATFQNRCRKLSRQLTKMYRFREALDCVYRVREGLTKLATENTIVCRCEELSCAEVDAGIELGGTRSRTLKVMTRLGMGPCQGRMCWPAMARRIARKTHQRVEEVGQFSFRPPTQPICLGDVLADNQTLSQLTDHPNVMEKSMKNQMS